MYFLAIETSCDETAAAVFTEEPRILANVIASQTDLHARYGGVVPEVAARAHMQRLLPVIDEALCQAGIRLEQVGCIAVHNTPGLVGSLLVGVSAAKMLAVALGVPLVAVNHIESHIYACRFGAPGANAPGSCGAEVPGSPVAIFPCVGLVVSGGHTVLFHCRGALDFEVLGSTLDDAAGEAFDKVASILGLDFPGGPAVEREAALGNPQACRFPRSFLHEDRLEFSFSGLKTAVLYEVHGQDLSRLQSGGAGARIDPQRRADVAASFQQAVVDVLVEKARQALRRTGLKRLAVGGGVAANRSFRACLQSMVVKERAELFVAPRDLCTDNAAMAALAVEKWRAGDLAPLDLDAVPAYTGKRKGSGDNVSAKRR